MSFTFVGMFVPIAISLSVLLVHFCSLPGMILAAPAEWFVRNTPAYIHKPLISCPVCMTPYWGTAIILLLKWTGIQPFQNLDLAGSILSVILAAGLNCLFAIILKKYEVMMLEEEHLTNQITGTEDLMLEQADKIERYAVTIREIRNSTCSLTIHEILDKAGLDESYYMESSSNERK